VFDKLFKTLCLAATMAGGALQAAHAEDTVGPFWGRPFPYGYVLNEPQDTSYHRIQRARLRRHAAAPHLPRACPCGRIDD
jgi:hypothetical protein